MRNLFILLSLLLLTAIIGCSTGEQPLEPVTGVARETGAMNHYCFGYYKFIADPAAGTLDIIPLRETSMHLNALPFLEPPALLYLSLESLEFNGNIIEAGIGLRHPFLGLTEFSGFDVCGIFITNGSKADFDDPDLRMAVEGDTRLLNPDGYTRWWNPAEFPSNGTIFGYKDGLLGAPDSMADYNCTLNGYKFFCDDLDDISDEVGDMDVTSRCLFSAGQKNVRHYTIELGDAGLEFNYAVDACWQFPGGDPPWNAPDDFAADANRAEAWNVSITELDNTLWNDGEGSGGDLSLLIDVWDHYDAGMNTVKIESYGNFLPLSESVATGGGECYSTYQLDIADATPAAGTIDLLVSVISEEMDYGGMLAGEPVTAYFTYTATVDDEAPVQDDFHEWWAGIGYNHYNLSRNPTVEDLDPASLTLEWSNTTSFPAHSFNTGGPAIADGKVFFVNEPSNYYWPSTQYRAMCISLSNGAEIWQTPINQSGEAGRSLSSPFWYEDKIYVGGDHVYCLDDETGAVIWSYDGAPSNNYSYTPNAFKVYEGKVYCTSVTGVFACLDADTGAELWTYVYENSEMFPATDGERVYFPSRFNFYCLDCSDGSLVWTQPLPEGGVAWSGPTIVGDRVYQNGWTPGVLYCFDKYDGTVIWSYAVSGLAYLNPTPAPFIDPTDDKPVFVFGSATSSSLLWAVKDDGATCSLFWSGNYGSTAPYYDAACAVYGDYIIAPSRHGNCIIIIDKMTGGIVTYYPCAAYISAQVGIAYDRLIVLSDDSVECYM